MVGSAVVRALQQQECRLLLATRAELDLTDSVAVERFFEARRPAVVVLAAARVGGILANRDFPVEFLLENLAIATNVIRAAHQFGTRRLLFLGSSCIYPRNAPQPIPEGALLTSPLEETNEAYALAKICGLKLCQYYRRQYDALYHSAMPTNLYGPGDNYHPEHSHVLPALIRRMHDAKEAGLPEIDVWGTGTPRREFLHVDDLASAVVHLLRVPDPPDWVNVGAGQDHSIREIAEFVQSVVGYQGRLRWDTSKPDGTPRKLLDTTVMQKLGWTPRIELEQGLRQTYASFLKECADHVVRR